MVSRIVTFLLAINLLLPAAMADERVLVELFASQNCQNCPKAHRTLKKVADEQGDLVVLTWSVDYWDYLGRKDPMAIGESNERQRGYVDRFHLRGPYTPQTVYNGVEQCAGNRPSQVKAALKRLDRSTAHTVFARIEENRLFLEGTVDGLADIWLVHFIAPEDNPTDMVNPVTQVDDLGPWMGGRAELDLPVCESGCVVIVQDSGFGAVRATVLIEP